MADLSTNIDFTFMELPEPTREEGEEGKEWPRVMIDIDGVDPIVQPLVLRLLQSVYEKSLERGAKYYFSVR